MEKHKSCQQGRKKVELSMSTNAGGGGIERVVVMGGALAVASLIAAFTIKKSSRKDGNKDTTNLAATDSCSKEEDGSEGLHFILQDSSSTLHQNSCCTNHGTSKIGITQIETCELVSTQSLITSEENTMQCERKDSVSGQQEILIHDAEQESIAMTGIYGDIEELSRPVSDNKPMNGVENESNVSLVMENIEIEIEDEAVDVDAEQPTAEEKSTLQSSLSSKEEEKSSISTGEEDEEEYSLMQSSFSTKEEDNEEYSPIRTSFLKEDDQIGEEEEDEEEYLPIRSAFPKEDDRIGEEEEEKSSISTGEEDEEYSLMQSSFSTKEEDEEEYSPIRLSFPKEDDRIGEEEEDDDEEEEYSPIRSSFPKEDNRIGEEEYSPMESSFSTEEEKDSPLQSSFSAEEEDENGENVPGMEEESSEGTWSSSPEPKMEVTWPAEMMRVLSTESKEMNISHRVSVKKSKEKDITAKIETYHYLAKMFHERGSNDGKNEKETQELVVMNDQKEHSAKRQIWVWLSLVLLLLLLLANCLLQSNYLSNSVSFIFPMK